MKICKTVQDVKEARSQVCTLGFVPTMGFLHSGHLSLVEKAREENDAVAASIFVNPMQFGSEEDLLHYPRALEKDLALLRDNGVAFVFIPEVHTLYPDGFVTKIDLGGVATKMEGASRPGHFSGVATVLTKLFNIVQPERAYFGQKDAQQCAVVKRLVQDLNIPVKIETVPTGREADGLACSSRNARLTPQEREKAPGLYHALCYAGQLFKQGERSSAILEKAMCSILHEYGLTAIDYAVIVDPELFERGVVVPENALALLAVQLGAVRLIDNMFLSE